MSINVNGNKITKFGKTLPIPYLDKVEIYDEQIKIFYSYYFAKPQEVTDDTFDQYLINALMKINTAFILMPKHAADVDGTLFGDAAEAAKPFITNNGLFDPKQQLLDDSTKIYDLFKFTHALSQNGQETVTIGDTVAYKIPKPSSNTGFFGLFYQAALGPGIVSGTETIYDDNGAQVERYLYEMTIDIANETTSDIYSLIQAVTNISGLEICLFMASTSLQIDDDTTHDELFVSTEAEHFKGLYGQQISDINYEVIANNGTFKSTPERVFRFVATGNVYSEGIVLQSIDKLYYAVAESVRTDILNNVRNVIQSGWKLPTGGTVSVNVANPADEAADDEVNDARNNILYVLEVFGSTPNLLPKLIDTLNVFPNTSTSTPVGRLHERLEIALFNANNAIKNSGSEVVKQINLNTYIKDLRTSPTYVISGRYSASAYGGRIGFNTLDEYIYHNAFRYGSYLDPNGYKETVFRPDDGPTGLVGYEGPSSVVFPDPVPVTAEQIHGRLETKTPAQLKVARDMLFKFWYDTAMILNDYGKPAESDYGKIIQFFGDPDRLSESFVVLSKMALIGIGEITEGQAVSLHSYVAGLSDSSRPRDVIESMYEGWYMSSYFHDYMDHLLATDYPGYEWVTSLARVFADVSMYVYQDLHEGENSIVHNQLSFLGTSVMNAQSYAMAFVAVNKYYENITHEMTDYNAYLSGFWWFDYEKALKERSLISFVWSVSKLDNFFDKRLCNGFFKVDQTTIDRYYHKQYQSGYIDALTMNVAAGGVPNTELSNIPDGSIKVGQLRSVLSTSGYISTSNAILGGLDYENSDMAFDDVSGLTDLPLNMNHRVDQYNQSDEAGATEPDENGITAIGTLGVDVAENESVEYTYNIMRNFKPLNDPDTDNYRLMCFEHQEVAGPFTNNNIYNESDYPYSALVHTLEVSDSTPQLMHKILKYYKDYLDGEFEDYYKSAIEQCSYNSYDDTFNDFFRTNAKAQFATAPNEAPWYKMPVLYHVHLDFLYDTYNGIRENIFAAALLDSEKISPDTGTFDMLLAFKQKVVDLFETQYNSVSENSALHRLNIATPGYGTLETYHDLEDFTPIVLTFNGNNSGLGNNTAYTNIPQAINLVNTLKYSPDTITVTDGMSNTIQEDMDIFVDTVANLIAFWSSGEAESYRDQTVDEGAYNLYVNYVDGYPCRTYRVNAAALGPMIWDMFMQEAGFEGAFGNLPLETAGQISTLVSYAGFTVTSEDPSIPEATRTFQTKLISIRNKINDTLMFDFYNQTSHPKWITSTDDLPMAEYYAAINATIIACINIVANMASSTYSYMTTGANPQGEIVANYRTKSVSMEFEDINVPAYIGYGLADYMFDDDVC